MTARIRSTVNGLNPVSEASRDDLAVSNVVGVESIDTATSYLWSIVYAPEGSTATFSGSVFAQNPGTFTVDVVGPYLISLTVDLALVTESIQYVRLRAPTSTGLLLVAAGEGVSGAVVIPVDLGVDGWADEQNANILSLESGTLRKTNNLSDLGNISTAKTNLNYVANEIGYSPTTPGNWSPSPAQLGSASDQLASRVTQLEAGPVASLFQRDWSGVNAVTTANVIAGGAAVSADVASWFNLGLVHRLKIVANSATISATFRLYADAAHTTLLYEALAINAWNSAYEDLVPFHYRDNDLTSKLHYTISNSGASNSTFTITIQGIGG